MKNLSNDKDSFFESGLYNNHFEVVSMLFIIVILILFVFCYSACVISKRADERTYEEPKK